jgi:hypothetical protein
MLENQVDGPRHIERTRKFAASEHGKSGRVLRDAAQCGGVATFHFPTALLKQDQQTNGSFLSSCSSFFCCTFVGVYCTSVQANELCYMRIMADFRLSGECPMHFCP